MSKDLFLNRNLAFANSFLFAFVQGILLPLYPYLANQLNLPISQVIFCFSLGTLLFAFSGPFWASKTDKWGAPVVLSIGTTGLFLSLLVIVIVFYFPPEVSRWSLGLLLLSRVLYGLTASGINPVSQSIHAQVQTTSSKPMILHSLCLNFGRLMGFCSLFFFIDSLNYIFSFILIALLFCFVWALSLLTSINLQPQVEKFAPQKPIEKLGFTKKPFLVAFCFSIYLELINSSLAGRIQQTFLVSGKEAAEQSAMLFLGAVATIVLVQVGLMFFKELSVDIGKFVGGLFLVGGGLLFGLFETKQELYLSIFVISLGLAMVPAFNLADLKKIFGLKGYAKRAGWMASFYTTGYAMGGVLAALAFNYSDRFFLFFLTGMGAILLYLCFPYNLVKVEDRGSEHYG